MSKGLVKLNLKCPYRIKSPVWLKHPTLCATYLCEYIYVPEYAINYVLDYFMKLEILAVENRDYKTFIKYGIYPRFIIKKGKFEDE